MNTGDQSQTKKISKKAIIYGFLVDVGGSLFIIAVISLALGAFMALQGSTPDELRFASQSNMMLVVSFVVGSIFSILGGFVTARVAKEKPMKHALYLGLAVWGLFALSVLVSYVTHVGYSGVASTVYNVLGLVSIIPLVLLGGHLASKDTTEKE